MDWTDLTRSDTPMESTVPLDDLTKQLITPFDYETEGTERFYPYEVPSNLPTDFHIGVIVGASGTGKSTLLRHFGEPATYEWGSGSIASHFDTADDALERLGAAGLMSVPEWVKPYSVLSNGQKFRADLAMAIGDNAVIDEFTSVVDRNVACAASTAMSKYVKKNNISNVVLATCHRDIIDYLQPDWVIDTDKGQWASGRWLHRPQLDLTIYPAHYSIWDYFSKYHYLTDGINSSARCYVATWNGQLVGFNSVLALPSGTLKNAYRGHRLVVHPDYQGFGFGPKISEAVAQHYVDNGKRYYGKTAHPRLGGYRDASPLWKATSKNHKQRTDTGDHMWALNKERMTYSHEYIGNV